MKEHVLTHEEVLALLPDRKPDSHKGDYGRILILAGSRGYTGAPALAVTGALRCGAGLVFLGVPACIYEIEAIKLTEPIVIPLADCNGVLSLEALPEIDRYLTKMDVVLIGPGLGQNEDTASLVKYVLKNFKGPVVLDADGINVLAEHKNILRDRTCPTIITPHEGEFVRLSGKEILNRKNAAMELASDLGILVVLKGHKTIITDGINCFINQTGNPGMAVGGSGDVLAGMIAALLGQGLSTIHAAACGAWLHGAAADLCAETMGQYALLPTDYVNVLPRLLK